MKDEKRLPIGGRFFFGPIAGGLRPWLYAPLSVYRGRLPPP